MIDIRTCAAFAVSLALLPGLSFGQEMCVPAPVEMERVEGIVLFEAGGKSRPLSDVTIAISDYTGSNTPPIVSTVTASDGHFSISNTAPGRYWLSVRQQAISGFTTD